MTLVFLHIDKTGGMTLRSWLASQYSTEHIRPVPCPTTLTMGSMNYPTTHMDLFAHNRKFTHNPDHWLVMGHYDYGIVQRIPDPKLVMTVLRDPVQRVVSLYQFILREDRTFAQLNIDAHSLGFGGWARKHVGLWENAMTRQLAGVRWSSSIWHEVDEAIYQQAEINLGRCDFVAVLEHLDDLIDRLSIDFNWTPPANRRLNTSNRKTVVDDATAEFIRQNSVYDTRLYLKAMERSQNDIQQSAELKRLQDARQTG